MSSQGDDGVCGTKTGRDSRPVIAADKATGWRVLLCPKATALQTRAVCIHLNGILRPC